MKHFAPPQFGTLFARLADLVLYPLRLEPALTAVLLAVHCSMPAAAIVSHLITRGSDEYFFTSHFPSLCMGVLLSWLLSSLAASARRPWARVAVLSVALVPQLTQLSLNVLFRQTINPSTLLMLLETTEHEAREFAASTAADWRLLVLMAAAAGIVVATERIRGHVKRLATHWLKPLTGTAARVVIALAALGLSAVGTYYELRYVRMATSSDRSTFITLGAERWGTHLSRANQPINCALYSIGFVRAYRQRLSASRALTLRILQKGSVATDKADSLTVLVVIGESHTRTHSHLYGYHLPDQPWQTAQRDSGRLVAFTDAVSSANHTISALLNAFSLNNPAEGQGFDTCAFWPAILKANGWRTHVEENQMEAPDNEKESCLLSMLMFPQGLSEALWDSRRTQSLEVDPDAPAPVRAEAKQLIIWHLIGQHMTYAQRYPTSHRRFSSTDIADGERPYMTPAKRQTEAEYANATLYNDHVLSRIASTVEDLDAVLLYFSDHGEEVYDYRDCYGRVMPEAGREREFLLCQAAVPMIAWWTPKFAALHPETVSALHNAADRPIYTPLIGHAVLGLTNLRNCGYNARYDFLSPEYVAPRRLVNEAMDYDEILACAN